MASQREFLDASPVSRISHEVAQHRDQRRCLHEMHARLECGWTISDVRLPGIGLYLVVYRKDGPP